MQTERIDNVSPVEALRRLRPLGRAFMLTGCPGWEGFSYVGAHPYSVIETNREGTTLIDGRPTGHKDPFGAVEEILRKDVSGGETNIPFTGGGVGFFSYDLKELLSRGGKPSRSSSTDSMGPELPLCIIGFYDVIFAYDHSTGSGLLVSTGPGKGSMREFMKLLKEEAPSKEAAPYMTGPISSNFTRDEYLETVLKAQEYISSGDIYQINLSQRLTLPIGGDPLGLYTRLIETSPAPFSSFFDYGQFQIISNSPERLLKVDGRTVETSPIKGTRPRGGTPEEDRQLIEELRTSVKERAEHVMIVDLERNDLGRVSEPGTVAVTSFERVETFPGLHHMVSTVRGTLRKGIHPMECLKSAFPGGSITGAPKIRAMEIIDEIEPAPRGVYTGGIGWMGFNGEMDISMAIRTAVVRNNTLYLHVGGGIVADSVPELEYGETLLKAKCFLDVVGAKNTAIV